MDVDKMACIEMRLSDLKMSIREATGNLQSSAYFKIDMLIDSIENEVSVIKAIIDDSKIKK